MKAAASVTVVILPLGLALRIAQPAPASVGSAVAVVGPKMHWDICATVETGLSPTNSSPIPRILHQTYKTVDIPAVYQRSHESWLQQVPDWEHHIWTDDDNREMVATHYPWFLPTYDAYTDPIERSDASRYLTLHRYGGIYADLDIEALRDPTPLISSGHELVLFYDTGRSPTVMLDPMPWAAHAAGRGGYQYVANAVMASAPGHPFWMYLARRLVTSRSEAETWVGRNELIEKFEKVMWATGPWFFSIAVNEYIKDNPETQAVIYRSRTWTPEGPLSNGGAASECNDVGSCREKYPDSTLFHHSAGQWVDWGDKTTKARKRDTDLCN